jgi:hypothetical protein
MRQRENSASRGFINHLQPDVHFGTSRIDFQFGRIAWESDAAILYRISAPKNHANFVEVTKVTRTPVLGPPTSTFLQLLCDFQLPLRVFTLSHVTIGLAQ